MHEHDDEETRERLVAHELACERRYGQIEVTLAELQMETRRNSRLLYWVLGLLASVMLTYLGQHIQFV